MTKVEGRERRGRERVALCWQLRLRKPGCELVVEAESENLSSEGFYCLTTGSFVQGERVECLLPLPVGMGPRKWELSICASIVRIEYRDAETRCGLACQIEDYCLVDRQQGGPASSSPSFALCRNGS
jgi:hypothetical protein